MHEPVPAAHAGQLPASAVRDDAVPLVIGLDLSLKCTGVAGAGWTDFIRPKKLTGHARLKFLIDEVTSFIRRADLVVIEGPSFGGGVKHRHEDLAGLRVMVRHACWRRDIPYAIAPPSCRALYAAGKGNACKGEVRTSVADRYGIELEGVARYDEADAYALLAMGLHHLGHPLADVPEKNASGLEGCQWPASHLPSFTAQEEGEAA
ncbi:hypothetical protein [Streptomyces sp. BA2]|uniref:hypothetical protein n=1 Tax=Streptomyces sp. BA2 TaxID=436595 RepID=UPI001F2ADE5C|nr:hypothetical protein [Streptomyces sp. BA2]